MIFPTIENLVFEQTAERLKVSIPLKRNWLLYGLFSLCVITWVAMVIIVLVFIFRDVLPNRERYTFVLTVMMVVWLVLWYYMGKAIWKQWQYYAASREILFINKEVLIVRRPVSILGITDAYDMQHVNPFYFDSKHNCPAFDYGSQRIYFGRALTESGANNLIDFLNGRYFPYLDEDEY
jgi:hypothetical protein